MLKAKLLISLAVIAGIHQFNDASATSVVEPAEMAMEAQRVTPAVAAEAPAGTQAANTR